MVMTIEEVEDKLSNMSFDSIVKSYCNKVNYIEQLKSKIKELSKSNQHTVSDSLPDDEEIERKAEFRQRSRNPKNTAKGEFIYGFIQGAEWIIDMISSNEA